MALAEDDDGDDWGGGVGRAGSLLLLTLSLQLHLAGFDSELLRLPRKVAVEVEAAVVVGVVNPVEQLLFS